LLLEIVKEKKDFKVHFDNSKQKNLGVGKITIDSVSEENE